MHTLRLQARNLGRVVMLDLLWSLRVPQNLLYQFFMAAVLLVMLAKINGRPGYVTMLVPGLMALAVASGSMQGLGTTMSYMRTYGAWRTARGSPIPIGLYLSGLVISRMVRILLVAVFLLIAAVFLVDYRLSGNPLLLAVLIVLGVALFGALGLVINYLVSAPQAVTGVINVLFLLMVFSSNVLFVTDVLWLKALSVVSPLTYFGRLLRAAAGGGWSTRSLVDLGVVLAWIGVLAWLALWLSRTKVEER